MNTTDVVTNAAIYTIQQNRLPYKLSNHHTVWDSTRSSSSNVVKKIIVWISSFRVGQREVSVAELHKSTASDNQNDCQFHALSSRV